MESERDRKIRERAYELWVQGGQRSDSAHSDWQQAEQEYAAGSESPDVEAAAAPAKKTRAKAPAEAAAPKAARSAAKGAETAPKAAAAKPAGTKSAAKSGTPKSASTKG